MATTAMATTTSRTTSGKAGRCMTDPSPPFFTAAGGAADVCGWVPGSAPPDRASSWPPGLPLPPLGPRGVMEHTGGRPRECHTLPFSSAPAGTAPPTSTRTPPPTPSSSSGCRVGWAGHTGFATPEVRPPPAPTRPAPGSLSRLLARDLLMLKGAAAAVTRCLEAEGPPLIPPRHGLPCGRRRGVFLPLANVTLRVAFLMPRRCALVGYRADVMGGVVFRLWAARAEAVVVGRVDMAVLV